MNYDPHPDQAVASVTGYSTWEIPSSLHLTTPLAPLATQKVSCYLIIIFRFAFGFFVWQVVSSTNKGGRGRGRDSGSGRGSGWNQGTVAGAGAGHASPYLGIFRHCAGVGRVMCTKNAIIISCFN